MLGTSTPPGRFTLGVFTFGVVMVGELGAGVGLLGALGAGAGTLGTVTLGSGVLGTVTPGSWVLGTVAPGSVTPVAGELPMRTPANRPNANTAIHLLRP